MKISKKNWITGAIIAGIILIMILLIKMLNGNETEEEVIPTPTPIPTMAPVTPKPTKEPVADVFDVNPNIVEVPVTVTDDNGEEIEVVVPIEITPAPMNGITANEDNWYQDDYEYEEVEQIQRKNWYQVEYDEAAKTLTMTGSGDEFGSVKKAYEMCDGGEVNTIIIREGVTTIPGNLFADIPMVKRVEFPKSLKRIGENAFAGIGTETDGVTYTGWRKDIEVSISAFYHAKTSPDGVPQRAFERINKPDKSLGHERIAAWEDSYYIITFYHDGVIELKPTMEDMPVNVKVEEGSEDYFCRELQEIMKIRSGEELDENFSEKKESEQKEILKQEKKKVFLEFLQKFPVLQIRSDNGSYIASVDTSFLSFFRFTGYHYPKDMNYSKDDTGIHTKQEYVSEELQEELDAMEKELQKELDEIMDSITEELPESMKDITNQTQDTSDVSELINSPYLPEEVKKQLSEIEKNRNK